MLFMGLSLVRRDAGGAPSRGSASVYRQGIAETAREDEEDEDRDENEDEDEASNEGRQERTVGLQTTALSRDLEKAM